MSGLRGEPPTVRARLESASDKARQLYSGRWLWDDDAEGFFAELGRRAEEIEADAVAALALLDEARAQEPWPDTRWVCIRDNRPDPVVLASRDPQDDEQGQT